MKAHDLMSHWQEQFGEPITDAHYSLQLNVRDAARLAALQEMFPSSTQEQILRDIVSAALNELEEGFPYRAGNDVIAHDEKGDPVYEDLGLTPQFLQLTHKHLVALNKHKH